VKKQEDHKKAL